MEVRREKLRGLRPLAEPGSPEHLRVRQLRARDLLRGDLDDAELEEHVDAVGADDVAREAARLGRRRTRCSR